MVSLLFAAQLDVAGGSYRSIGGHGQHLSRKERRVPLTSHPSLFTLRNLPCPPSGPSVKSVLPCATKSGSLLLSLPLNSHGPSPLAACALHHPSLHPPWRSARVHLELHNTLWEQVQLCNSFSCFMINTFCLRLQRKITTK